MKPTDRLWKMMAIAVLSTAVGSVLFFKFVDLSFGTLWLFLLISIPLIVLGVSLGVSTQARSRGTKASRKQTEDAFGVAGEHSDWTAERLKEHVQNILQNRPFLVVANREPYIHVHKEGKIECLVPVSGLVTAVEPILRATGGTWVATGSGDADKEMADEHGRLKVPPEDPEYTLRRMWLTEEEERGYYFGFANEAMWPLCHIAHTKPVFRVNDWEHYRKVNMKYAEAVLEELEGTEEPFVLIQDYHFSLLPRLIKDKRPDARIALFWHIPWSPAEAFLICPWAKEILHGLLGADLLGFHIQSHCNNFLESVDRILESRVDRSQFVVNRAGHKTWVKPFPISIAPESDEVELTSLYEEEQEEKDVRKEFNLKARFLGVGVDRIDYTKGIGERFRGVERFLDKNPEFVGNFTFVELAAPSRTGIKSYSDLGAELREEADRINAKFGTEDWNPILFLEKNHSHKEINRFYRISDICLITTLHDGMNLVAKEFVSLRSDEQGVLILSRFAGASVELKDALLVNPYDTDQVADAILEGLMMSPEEQQSRMSRMREIIQKNNVFGWAADLVTELNNSCPPLPQQSVHVPSFPNSQ